MTRVWLQLPDLIGASTWNVANRSAGQFEEVMNNDEHTWPKSVHWQLRTVSTGDLWSQRFQRPVKPRLVVMLFIFGLIFKSQVDADKTDGTNKQHVFRRSDWTVTRCCVSSPCHESVYGCLSRFVTILIWRMTILLWTWATSYWRRSKIKRWPTGTSPLYSTQCGCLAYCLAMLWQIHEISWWSSGVAEAWKKLCNSAIGRTLFMHATLLDGPSIVGRQGC